MSRTICALLAGLTLLAPVAEAKVLVVHRQYSQTTAGSRERQIQHGRSLRLLTQTFKTLGVDYKLVTADVCKTEFARTGTMVWNYGTAGAYIESFDAVIHLPAAMGTSAQNAAGEVRMDSLLLTARGGPTVPQLYLLDNSIQVGLNAAFMACTVCSSGVATAIEQTNGAGVSMFHVGAPTTTFLGGTYVAGWELTQPHSSGLRKHIIGSASAYALREKHVHDFGWLDSTNFAATDTVLMWEIPFTNITDAKPVVVAAFCGAGAPNDSVYDAAVVDYRPPAELEIPLMLAGLARLDSLAGGAVFGKNRLPLQIAFTIDNALSRGRRRAPGGILPSDTASFYAALDSIAALNVPVTFGVNADPDTIAEYARDIIKLKAIPKARFTPQVMSGVDSSTAMVEGEASSRRPLDIMGRFRRRAAYGDGSRVGADTSVYGLLMRARHYADSTFGRSRFSATLLPPNDDWSPKNLTNGQSSPGLDSLFWAIQRAGFKAIRTNVQHPDANPSYLRVNPLGYYREQMTASGRVGGTDVDSLKYALKLVGHSGFPIIGGWRQGSVGNDSTSAHSLGFYGNIYVELARMWYGATQDWDFNYDVFPRETFVYTTNFLAQGWVDVDIPSADLLYVPRRSNVKKWHCSDFSGTPNGPPALNGWWAMKSIVNAATVINRLAGRPIVTFCYPEELALER